MHYEGDIIRPPSEANSIILQVTVGCSHNRCTFCGAYRDRSFRIKDPETIHRDLDFAARYCRRQKTVFLADGDALAMPQAELVTLLRSIREKLPWIRRVGLYANAGDIMARSPGELTQLKNLGLGRVYMGLESGHADVLRTICKGAGPEEMIRAGQRIRETGLFLSVTVLLGIAGPGMSQAHARSTAEVLNAMGPSQIAVLTLMILDNTPLARQQKSGRFTLPDLETLFRELRTMLTLLTLDRTQFQANHASNYFSLDGRLSRDREKFIHILDQALSGALSLKPEHHRAL